MKKYKLIITLIILLILLFSIIDALFIAPRNTKVRKEIIINSKIPKEFDGFTIIFISDIHYNNFMDYSRFKKIIDKINLINPDLIIFGGDLFDRPKDNFPNEKAQQELIELLNTIEAKYGKFAVYGNHDLESISAKEVFENIMNKTNFKILKNNNVQIHYNSEQYFNLIGIDSLLYGDVNISESFNGITDNHFNLTVCHTPDIFDQLNDKQIDLLLSGHSHGGQINFFNLFTLYKPEGAKNYTKGKYHKNNSTLDVTTGLGTTRFDIRFNAPSEIVVYKLKNK